MSPVDLSGRVALVTGASRGIGLATTRRLVACGATVVMTSREAAESVIDSLPLAGPGTAVFIPGCVENPDFIRALFRRISADHKRLDILVNNAGIFRTSVIGMIPDAEINHVLSVNLASVLHMTQCASRLLARSRGCIVNMSSIVGLQGAAGQMIYAASKAGVIGATLAAARELGPKGVRVNAIAPGFIETQMTDDISAQVKEDVLAKVSLRRLGCADEIADVVLFLVSDMARYVTGQVIGVDGGLAL